MAQINNLTSYPTATPPLSANSIVIGSIASGGATNNFLMSDIATYVMGANTLTLQDVCDNGTATTTGITVGGTTTLNGNLDANSTADIADTLTLSKPSGTALSVSAGSVYFASNLDVFGLHHQWGGLTVEGITNLNAALNVTGVSTLGEIDASGVADIADTLTLSKVTGTGLAVTADATVGGVAYLSRLSVSSVASFSYVDVSAAIDANSTANIADTLTLSKATGTGLQVDANANISGRLEVDGNIAANGFLGIVGGLKFSSPVPLTSSSSGSTGTFAVDTTHIYVCTATNTWGRVAIDTTPF
jgi:hypothetical protein